VTTRRRLALRRAAAKRRRRRTWIAAAALFALTSGGLLWKAVSSPARPLPGQVVVLAENDLVLGTVVDFDPRHSFGVGAAGPAFEIQTSSGRSTIWVSEHVVLRARVQAGS